MPPSFLSPKAFPLGGRWPAGPDEGRAYLTIRKRAMTDASPSSVRFADSFPKGKPFSARYPKSSYLTNARKVSIF